MAGFVLDTSNVTLPPTFFFHLSFSFYLVIFCGFQCLCCERLKQLQWLWKHPYRNEKYYLLQVKTNENCSGIFFLFSSFLSHEPRNSEVSSYYCILRFNFPIKILLQTRSDSIICLVWSSFLSWVLWLLCSQKKF